ncbi:zinc finger, C2H2 type [Dictyocaulus viviparus]|uniref:Zinc finger, C2H2 type n=1 Tax=Dictyocaulus viviparus TaxID=29172 RepID=A0A0D8XK92_DICVI|nr:zinc finger, C2H2 type [Dictyocaulus viviparus]
MSSLDPSTGFTCVSCHLVFKTPEIQRHHYKTDWHRYNLKRQVGFQVSELPPVTEEQFCEKVLAYQAEKEALEKEEYDISTLYCSICRKKLKSRNSFKDHVASKKHKEMESIIAKSAQQVGTRTSQRSVQSRNQEEKQIAHGSEFDNVDDDSSSSGWVTDLDSDNEKNIDFDENQAIPITSCLFCSQANSSKGEAVEHMRLYHDFVLPDKKYLVDEEGMLNYLGLKVGAGRCCIYCPDIRSRFASVVACQSHMRDKQHCKINREPEGMLEFAEFYDYSPLYENEGEGILSDRIFDDGWTLTLPSGAKIGHRSLMMYYRQYLRPTDVNRSNLAKVAADKAQGYYPALGWTGATGTVAKQAARDIKFVQRYRQRFDLRVRLKSNKLFQTKGRKGDN